MLRTTSLMIAAALTAATPALAQNMDNSANAADTAVSTTTTTTNETVTTDPAMTAPANDMAAVPVASDQPLDAPYDAPPPPPKRSFPWGVLGLLGLVGLLGRKRG